MHTWSSTQDEGWWRLALESMNVAYEYGVQSLLRFVEDGGLLVTARDTSVWAIEYGLARWVRVVETSKLKAPGTIVQSKVDDKKSVIVQGYDDTIPLYYSGSPVLAGKPAVILAPRGKGNVLLFATNPMWRMNTYGAYALVMNAVKGWDSLR